eukprot:305863-Alexandrium_andersonii.AAC.1
MSASLVGSEMCIRDSRGNTLGAETPSCLGPGPSPERLGADTSCCPEPGPCLLYTSDAADDM